MFESPVAFVVPSKCHENKQDSVSKTQFSWQTEMVQQTTLSTEFEQPIVISGRRWKPLVEYKIVPAINAIFK
jgi:hypothetical protein